MGSPILSFPPRLSAAGTFAVVDQDSVAADAEQIGLLIATHQGEREMTPGFGIPDPTFDSTGINSGAIVNGVALYGPPVRIARVDVSTPSEAVQTVIVEFE